MTSYRSIQIYQYLVYLGLFISKVDPNIVNRFVYRSTYTLISEARKMLELQGKRGDFDINFALKPNLITNALASGLATGNWGDMKRASGGTSRIYVGVSQVFLSFFVDF